MFDLTWTGWLIATLSAMMIGVSKTGVPGVGILAIPMFAAILPARASTGALLPILIAGDIIAVSWYRRNAVWPHLLRILPWTITGVVAGYFVMGYINDRQLRPIIGLIVLGMLGLNAWRNRRPDAETHIPSNIGFAAFMGLMAGLTTMMANAAGPIMAIYLLAMRLPKTEFLGTGAWYFLLVNLFKVPFSAHLGLIHEGSLHFNLVLLPAVAIGAGIGILVARRLPEKIFNQLVQILAAAAAIRLLW